MHRPAVDIVVPFVGTEEELSRLVDRMRALDRIEGDSISIADNRPHAGRGHTDRDGVTIVGAAGYPSSYFARNCGAARGRNPWLVFLDADVEPGDALLQRYFDPPPAEHVAILIGGVHDAPPGPRAVEHYAHRRGAVAHTTTLLDGGFAFAQTANVAVRRAAFDAVGGFEDDVRSGGDADLCFRIQQAGYAMEPRFDAAVTHRNRTDLRAFLRQYAKYGSGGAWLDRRYPGFAPRPRAWRVGVSLAAAVVRAGGAMLRRRPLDAKVYLLDGAQKVAYVAGRRWPNEVAR